MVNTLVILESCNVDLKYLAFEFDLEYSRRLNVVVFGELITLFLSITYYSYMQRPDEIFFHLSTFQSLCLDFFWDLTYKNNWIYDTLKFTANT